MIALTDFHKFIRLFFKDIRQGEPQSLTQKRKTTPLSVTLQMFSQKGNSQFSELFQLL